jgi:GWxTD domain-containing protein
MKIRLCLLFTFAVICINSQAQALRDIDYSYYYNPSLFFSFDIKPVKQAEHWTIFYKLQLLDTAYTTDDLSITWEKREALSDKQGISQPAELSSTDSKKMIGKLTVSLSQNPQLLVAKITHKIKKQLWIFYKSLDPNFPVSGYLQTSDGEPVFNSYIHTNKTVVVHGFTEGQSLSVSYYNDNFPAAAPAFSEGLARVSQRIKPDSAFFITAAQSITLDKIGAYLIQKDTNSVEGISFRVEDDYPKFNKVQNLVAPLIYICTKEEFQQLRNSGNDKKRFDRGLLGITQDEDRARIFIKNYFRRAELANYYFTSYKEGWKTDRGMIYLIYGEPQQVFKFSDREVWTYGKTEFSFVRSATLFDPENYVLIRNKKFGSEWYEKVDLLRNGRF